MKSIGFSSYKDVTHSDSFVAFEEPAPKPAGRDLLVQVDAISVNPVDTKMHRAKANEEGEMQVLGWDAVGTVIDIGASVSLFKPGDKVFYAGDVTRRGSNSEQQLVDERIVGRAPTALSNAQAAAVPLTALTAWEALFERMDINLEADNGGKLLLIIGAGGGVGSMACQLGAKLAGMTVVGTASKKGAIEWCIHHGARHVVNHYDDMAEQMESLGYEGADYILCCSQPDEHFDVMCELIKPQGKICCIVDNAESLPLNKLKSKSAALIWEFMFTRSMYKTPDMIEQHHILSEMARLLDEGVLESTLTETLSPINPANLREAHRKLEAGEMIGKLVLEGWG